MNDSLDVSLEWVVASLPAPFFRYRDVCNAAAAIGVHPRLVWARLRRERRIVRTAIPLDERNHTGTRRDGFYWART